METKLMKVMAVLLVVGLMAGGPGVYAESQDGGAATAGDPGALPSGSGDDGSGYGRPDPKEFFKELNLTPEQKEKLKVQREAKMESTKAVRDQMKKKMQALHEVVAKPGTTRAEVSGLIDEVNALKGQMFAQNIDGIFAMKEILTPEQFAKMQDQHKGWMQKKHDGWGKKDQDPKKS